MSPFWRDFLIPPASRSGPARAEAESMRIILALTFSSALIGGAINFLVLRSVAEALGFVAIGAVALSAAFLLNTGRETAARLLTPAGILAAVVYLMWNGNGLHDLSAPVMVLILVVAALTGGEKGVLLYTGLVSAALIVVGVSEINGWMTPAEGIRSDPGDVFIAVIVVLVTSALLRLVLRRLNESIQLAQKSAAAQSQANEELLGLQASLEQQIEERTRELALRSAELEERSIQMERLNSVNQRRVAQLQAVSDVSQQVAFIRDISELLNRVAKIISEQFGFYHVGVFFKDAAEEFAILTASNSQGGQRMLARGHKLRLGEGLVGTAAQTGLPRIALDTGADAVYFNNPDLPNTRSEMALPMKTGDRLIGVLDVQSAEANAFSEDDIQALTTLANQVAIAIENARLFSDSIRALNEAQTVYKQSLRREWSRSSREAGFAGFRNSPLGPQPLSEPLDLPEIRKAVRKGRMQIVQNEDTAAIAVPLKVRDQVIGVLNIRPADVSAELSQDELDLVQAVAERVSLSMENARLFEETSRRAERERSLGQITSKIRSTNDPGQMLQIALQEIQQALNVKNVRIVQNPAPHQE